jgi:hypothetical protein
MPPPSTAIDEPVWLRQAPPTLHSDDGRVGAYIDKHINPLSPRWRWHTQRAGLNLWFYLGRQWLESVAEMAPGGGAYHFREVYRDSVATFPRPVTNIIAPAVDNEVSRLSRKEYVPDTSAGKSEPEWMAAARTAKDIVTWNMNKQIWAEKREETVFNLCNDSVVGLKTWWDENDTEVSLISPEDPRRCPRCASLFASARVPESFARTGYPVAGGFAEMQHKETLVEAPEPDAEATAVHPKGTPEVEMRLCPMCPEPSNLEPYEISEEEAGQEDAFGRPLGVLVPRGDGLIDTISIHEFFPENGGIGCLPREQRLYQHMHVKPLEWAALRFPEIADKLEPEEPKTLLRVHPLYSDNAFIGRFPGLHGPEVYTNHAMVKELTVLPQPHIPGLELGAHFAQICGEIVRRPLCVEVEGEGETHLVPRVKYHFARFKHIPKLFYSRSFVDDLIPIQRRLNETDAQDIDLRERGKPMMWVPPGTQLHFRDDVEGSMQIMEYDNEGSDWHPRDALFPGGPLTGASYHAERQQCFTDAQLIGAAQDIEMGRSPGSVKTTSGLMLLSEESATKRGPRERSLVGMYSSAFEHVLELNHAFRQEDQPYEVMSETGIQERKSYSSEDLVAGIKVQMKARAGYDEMLYNKEATGEAIGMGLYDLNDPAAVDRVLDNMRLPKDINQRATRQIVLAEMAWSNFMRGRRIPVVDATVHAPRAWHSVLTNRWLSDEAYALQQKAKWDAVVLSLANWEVRMAQEEATDAQQKAIYGAVPPAQWAQKYAEGQRLRQDAVAAQEATAEAAQDLQKKLPPGAPGAPEATAAPAPLPQVPPPPMDGFLPEDLGRRIYAVWRRMLPDLNPAYAALSMAKSNDAPLTASLRAVELIDQLLQMKAVIEQCRVLAAALPPAAPGPLPGQPTPPGQPPAGPPAGGPAPAA